MLNEAMKKLFITAILLLLLSIKPLLSSDNSVEKLSVIRLQIYLKSIGHNIGSLDGIYGKKTESALKKTLSEQNIEWDNHLDQIDLQAIKTAVSKSPYLFKAKPENQFLFDIQEQLIIAGFLNQGFTGLFDEATKVATSKYFEAQSLKKSNFFRDKLPTYNLLKSLRKYNKGSRSTSQSFLDGILVKTGQSKITVARKTLSPLNLSSISKKQFTRVEVACGGTANGDIKNTDGRYFKTGKSNLDTKSVMLFELNQNSFNNCGDRIRDSQSKSWEKSKARAELQFLGMKARKGYTYIFDANFAYKRKSTSNSIANSVNDRTLIFQIKADPNPKCGPIVALKIHGWKGQTRLEVNSTYIEVDNSFSYQRNAGGKITCHQWDSKFLPIPFGENKKHKLRIELSVLDFNHYFINVFINDEHVRTIDYNYKKFPKKVHAVDGFYVPFGLYQMPNKFRSSGQYSINAEFSNVGLYETKSIASR